VLEGDSVRILVIDDDLASLGVLGAYIEREGYEFLQARDGETALNKAAKADLVILDLMLPVLSGWEVAETLLHTYPELPILILTALDSEEELVQGLDLGADDYVAKPFSPREVMARAKALLRRTGLRSELNFGDLLIRPASHEVYLGGELLTLQRLEFDLLLTLAQHPGMVWRRERLVERVWGPGFTGVTRVVDVRVAALRKKLREHSHFVETVHGVGYKFKSF
jgi:two-component system alkaline phosphatase synthesis response regulator PhoP